MFLKPKKGNLVAQFVVLLVVAVILIFVVSSFGAKIWQAFFPSADKSTIKSFDSVFNVFNAKAASQQDYDSTTINIYLKDGYRIIFFDGEKLECLHDHWYGPTIGTAYAPKECTKGKQCMCLYKKMPSLKQQSTDMKDRESNLVKCYSFENHINIELKNFDFNNIACNNKDTDSYGSYMFIKRTIYPPILPEKKDYVYVIEDNDANRALDADWSIPVCKTTDSSNPCYGKRNGDTVEATDQNSLGKIDRYCKTKDKDITYKSTSVKCEYLEGGTDCDTNCKDSDVTDQCNVTYSTCEDYNQLISSMGFNLNVEYISADEEYKYYGMCKFDATFCDIGKSPGGQSVGCGIADWNIYACKDSKTGATETNTDCAPPYTTVSGLEDTDCKVELLKNLDETTLYTGVFVGYIASYDTTNKKCNDYMIDKFYDKQPVMVCKKDMSDMCQKYIKDKEKTCKLKFIAYGQDYWLMHYDSTCEKDVKELFASVSFCKTL